MKETNEFEKKRRERRFDLFLLFSLSVIVLVLVVTNIIAVRKNQPKRTDLVLSRQWETLFDQETRNELTREFEEKNPHLRLKLAATETEAPATDIIFFDESRFATLLEKNALHMIDAEFAETSFVGKNNAGGWAIPLALSMDLLFYNIDLLSAAGFDRPPKTREEFLRYAQRVTGNESTAHGAALALSPQDPLSIRRDFFSWFWAAGLSLSDDLVPDFDTRAATDIITFMGQINKQLIDENPFEKTGTHSLEEFAQGKIAMLIAPAHSISTLRNQMGLSTFGGAFMFGVTVIPGTATPAKNSLCLSGYYAGISADCAHSEEAEAFLAFLAGKGHLLAEKINAMQNSLSGPRVEADPLYEKAWDIFDSSDIAENFSLVPHSVALEQIVREELRKFFSGEITAQNTATSIKKQWDAISDKED